MAFHIHPLPVEVLSRVRASGLDVSGSPVARVCAEGGEPLRCCLRNATPGEALILFGYEPPIAAGSPYREVGAVFAHEGDCGGFRDADYPSGWRGRRQVLRSYDARGWIVDAVVHEGGAPEPEIERLLADPRAVQVHSRNVAYGCFMFAATRAG